MSRLTKKSYLADPEKYPYQNVLMALAILIGRATRNCKCGACDELEAHTYELLIDCPDEDWQKSMKERKKWKDDRGNG